MCHVQVQAKWMMVEVQTHFLSRPHPLQVLFQTQTQIVLLRYTTSQLHKANRF